MQDGLDGQMTASQDGGWLWETLDSKYTAKKQNQLQILTHGFELPDELLFCPLCPFLLVGVYWAQDGAARFPAVLDGRDVQVVHQHNVWVLQGQHSKSYIAGGSI